MWKGKNQISDEWKMEEQNFGELGFAFSLKRANSVPLARF